MRPSANPCHENNNRLETAPYKPIGCLAPAALFKVKCNSFAHQQLQVKESWWQLNCCPHSLAHALLYVWLRDMTLLL